MRRERCFVGKLNLEQEIDGFLVIMIVSEMHMRYRVFYERSKHANTVQDTGNNRVHQLWESQAANIGFVIMKFI